MVARRRRDRSQADQNPCDPKDQTDRNRTSPFAFTGNRFEFRAVGASANCAAPMTTLNTIVANQLSRLQRGGRPPAQDQPQHRPEHRRRAPRLHDRRRSGSCSTATATRRSGKMEAAARGLSNNKATPEALEAMISDEAAKVFAAQGVFNQRELHSRYEVLLENYIEQDRDRSRPARGAEHDARASRRLRCDQPAQRDPPKPR